MLGLRMRLRGRIWWKPVTMSVSSDAPTLRAARFDLTAAAGCGATDGCGVRHP